MWDIFKKIRPNVLILVGLGYGTIFAIFVIMVLNGETDVKIAISTAYDIVKGPLMALIGGSLAISKDLLDDSPPSSTTGNGDPKNLAGEPKTD